MKVEQVKLWMKKVSRHWYLKFEEIIISMGFVENKIDDCIYLKITGSKFIILTHYVDDI